MKILEIETNSVSTKYKDRASMSFYKFPSAERALKIFSIWYSLLWSAKIYLNNRFDLMKIRNFLYR